MSISWLQTAKPILISITREVEMNYEFPYITNISDVLPAIEGRPEFAVAENELEDEDD